jgi:hypothetical protein
MFRQTARELLDEIRRQSPREGDNPANPPAPGKSNPPDGQKR